MNENTQDVIDRMAGRSSIMVGDYVEVLKENGGGIKPGEQGFVFEENFGTIKILFPARNDVWTDTTIGWLAPTNTAILKRVYRPAH